MARGPCDRVLLSMHGAEAPLAALILEASHVKAVRLARRRSVVARRQNAVVLDQHCADTSSEARRTRGRDDGESHEILIPVGTVGFHTSHPLRRRHAQQAQAVHEDLPERVDEDDTAGDEGVVASIHDTVPLVEGVRYS